MALEESEITTVTQQTVVVVGESRAIAQGAHDL
jgi:hypothetical protein